MMSDFALDVAKYSSPNAAPNTKPVQAYCLALLSNAACYITLTCHVILQPGVAEEKNFGGWS